MTALPSEHLARAHSDNIATMARLLSAADVDLGNEMEVIETLLQGRFRWVEVKACMDEAIELSRKQRVAA